jgi:putative flippase GtrA
MKKCRLNWGEVVRFVIVGLTATAIHYIVYLFLQQVIALNLAYTTGFIVSLCCNFVLSAKFTFRTGMSMLKGGGFVLSHVANYLMHIGLFNLLLYVGVGKIVAPLIVYAVVVPINFVLVSLVFKRLQ